MRKFLVFPFTVIVLLLIALLTTADQSPGYDDEGNLNDPHTNERANACYAGYFDDRIAGKCSTSDLDLDGTVEEWEIEAMWNCGWHLIRFEYGMIEREDFAPFCEWMLPEEETPAPEVPEVPLPVPDAVFSFL